MTILEDSFHQECFSCARCRTLFPAGTNINFDGNDYYCEICIDELDNEPRKPQQPESNCAGCGNAIKSGQALLALESQWHLWCFTCHKCGCLLSGEYMGRDGVPYCEKDYQNEFGVSCAGCGGYITGKVLQAGEKHYHPQCSRCAKCDQMFGEGEEMYLQGSEIWHPRCSDEYQRDLEESARLAEEQKLQAEEQARQEEQARKAEEQARRAEEQARRAEEEHARKAEEQARKAEEQARKAVEEQTRKAEEEQARRAEEQARREEEQARKAEEQARNAENRARTAYQNSVRDAKPEHVRQPPPVRPKSASPPPVDTRNDEISNATRNYIQRPYQPPQREEAPAQTKPCEASEARPFGSQKTTAGSISINFKPKSTLTASSKWKPPESKTNEPTRTAPAYRPSTTPVPAKEPFKRAEPPRTAVVTENSTKYNVSVDSRRSISPPSGKEDAAPPAVNGYQKTPSVSSEEGAPARPPPPPTRGSSQNWKSRISPSSTVPSVRPTSPPSPRESSTDTSQGFSSNVDVRTANKPLTYIDSAAKRNEPTETESKTTKTTTNITIKIVSASDDAPLPNALYRRVPARDRELARENRKSMPSMPDSMDHEPVVMRENGPARTEAKVMNRRSLPSMDKFAEEQARKSYPVFPYHVLKTSNYKMPKEIDRSCLEVYLAEDEFEKLFKMEKSLFYKQPAWKQRDLKKRLSLF